MNVSFSGHKGYHIGLDCRIFGQVQASKWLHRLHAELRREIVSSAGIREVHAFDQAICDKTRLWRLVNTRHSKSGLYKVQLEVDELFRLSVEAIKELAQAPRPTRFTDETGLLPKAGIAAFGKAAALYRKSLSKVKKTCPARKRKRKGTNRMYRMEIRKPQRRIRQPMSEGFPTPTCTRRTCA